MFQKVRWAVWGPTHRGRQHAASEPDGVTLHVV